jgi:hypothetical protein
MAGNRLYFLVITTGVGLLLLGSWRLRRFQLPGSDWVRELLFPFGVEVSRESMTELLLGFLITFLIVFALTYALIALFQRER